MHPVAQGLAIHTAGLRRFGAGTLIENQGERRQVPDRVGVLGRRCCLRRPAYRTLFGDCTANPSSCELEQDSATHTRVEVEIAESEPARLL